MLLGTAKNHLAFYFIMEKKKGFLIAISNMPSFFKVLHKGLG